MKRLFNRTSKSFAPLQINNSSNATIVPTAPSLQPKYVVPPVPHPSPYAHLALLVTDNGLLIRPHILNKTSQHPLSHVKVSWGKNTRVEEQQGDGTGLGCNWEDSVIVYGILGVLELFSGMDFPNSIPSLYSNNIHSVVSAGGYWPLRNRDL